MQAIPLGKITVSTAGTPVPITAATIAAAGQFPLNGGILKIEALPKPANGHAQHWQACGPEGENSLNPTAFAIDAATSGDGAFVTVWVD